MSDGNGTAEHVDREVAVGHGARVVPLGAVRECGARHGEGARPDLPTDQPGLSEWYQGV